MTIVVGTAGWTIPRVAAHAFGGDGRHLTRYARELGGVEINSSFHRPHKVATYARWATETRAGFRFAVKLPRTITHVARLREPEGALDAFLAEVSGLGDKLAVLLVQLPPSFAFEETPAEAFFAALRVRYRGDVVCEPRHASWFAASADAALVRHRIARAAVDPASLSAAAQPGGWVGAGAPVYYRWHGAPRTYWSAYTDDWLAARVAEVERWAVDHDVWCMFDNTASGAATDDALRFRAMLPSCRPSGRGFGSSADADDHRGEARDSSSPNPHTSRSLTPTVADDPAD